MFNRIRIELALRLRQQATLPKSISTLAILQNVDNQSFVSHCLLPLAGNQKDE